MSNDAIKEVFRALHAKVTKDVDPDSAIDELYAKKIIGDKDYGDLYDIQDTRKRCRKFLSLLHNSSHPETFIHLREVLSDEYPSIVDEIDKQLPAQTAQLQQLQLDEQSTEGEFIASW